jgi:tetratricopeptide (TPR) repeat protein
MSDGARVVLVYRRPTCEREAQRLLDILDDRYRDRSVVDFGIGADAAQLEDLERRLASEDVVLVLVDPEWEYWRGGDGGEGGEGALGHGSTLRVAVGTTAEGTGFSVSETSWGSDVEELLEELDLRLGEQEIVSTTEEGDSATEEMAQLFEHAAQLQKGGRNREAVAALDTVIRSGAEGLAGPAAYASGRSYERLKDSNHAVRAYREAISLGPRDAAAAAAYNLGRLLARRKEFGEAATAFSEAIKLGDDAMRASAQERRIDALRRAGRG